MDAHSVAEEEDNSRKEACVVVVVVQIGMRNMMDLVADSAQSRILRLPQAVCEAELF
jgi:hypothetical protein